jgi:predicted nucleic acid-binding protein
LSRGLLDTSVLIAAESGRELDSAALPDDSYISVVTLAELRAGVLAARDSSVRARRLATLEAVAVLDALPVDGRAAAEWARMRVALHEARRRIGVNDLWIASVAAANDMPVVSQDRDYEVLAELRLVEVVLV